MQKLSFIIRCAFLLALLSQNAYSQESTVLYTLESSGTVKVLDENWALARKKAIKIAMRDAVAIQLTRMLELEEKIFDQYKNDLDPILRKSASYVQSYQILEETMNEEENLLTLRLNTGLYNTALAEVLYRVGISSDKTPAEIRIILLIGEKNLVDDGRVLAFNEFEPISEILLADYFQQKDIHVLDRSDVSEIVDESKLKRAMRGDIKAAIAVGIQCGVEVVIMGTATSRERPPNPDNPSLHTTQANISLRLIRVDKGSVVGVSSEFATGYGADSKESELEAMSKASSKLGDFFVKQITNLWEK